MKPDDIEQRVFDRLRSLYGEAASPLIADISQRQAFGVAKYGVRLKDNPAPLAARLRHMLEELLDAAVYAEWIRDGYSHGDRMWNVLEEMQDKLFRMAIATKRRCYYEPPTSKPVTDDGEVAGKQGPKEVAAQFLRGEPTRGLNYENTRGVLALAADALAAATDDEEEVWP